MTADEKIRVLAAALAALVLQVDSAKWPAPYNPALVDALGGARAALALAEEEV